MNKTVAPEPWLHLTPARSMNLPGKHRTSNACSPCTLRLLTPTLLTRSRPLVRPSRACGFAHIPFAAPQAAQVDSSPNLHSKNHGRVFHIVHIVHIDRDCPTRGIAGHFEPADCQSAIQQATSLRYEGAGGTSVLPGSRL